MTRTVDVTTPNDREIRVTRDFSAPRALVYAAHTEPDLLKKWLLGPPGWTMPVCEIDLRPGGAYRHVWRSDENGDEFTIGGEYREIVAPERIVTVERFEGKEALCTLTLTEEGGRTRLVQTMAFGSREERDQALATGMTDGMAASYDRLESAVLSAPSSV